MKQSIAALLDYGESHAKTMPELMKSTGLSKREICKAVQQERKNGILILSKMTGSGGYYLPANKNEVMRFYKAMQSRGKNSLAACKCASIALKKIDGQITLDNKLQGIAGE